MAAIDRLKELLDSRAEADPLFAVTYAKENKSMETCWKYVLREAKKLAEDGCCAVSDDEVVGWAIHYYDEDALDEELKDKPKPEAKVTTNSSVETPKPTYTPPPAKKTKQELIDEAYVGSLFDNL